MCPNCAKKRKEIVQNMNLPKSSEFKLMFYIGSNTKEESNDSRFLYVDLIYGEQYYVYKEDWNESWWSLNEPLVGEEE